MESVFRILLGVLALLLGRNLFWLFIGIVGFLFAAELVASLLPPDAIALRIALPVVAGIVGALLAVLAERLAFGIAGFFATTYFLMVLIEALGGFPYAQIVAYVGGAIGALIAVSIMDWALIILSAVVGAGVIVEELTPLLGLEPQVQLGLLVALAPVGMLVQWAVMKSRQQKPEEPPR